jgi:hypothetical protein
VKTYRLLVSSFTACLLAATLSASCKSNTLSNTDNNTDIIGPDGGEIDGPNGSKIKFPAGAVSKPTEITISVVSHTVPNMPETEIYSLEPHGTLFGGTVTVSLPLLDPTVKQGPSCDLYLNHASCDSSGNCGDWDGLVPFQIVNGNVVFSTSSFSLYVLLTGGANNNICGSGAGDAGEDVDASDH